MTGILPQMMIGVVQVVGRVEWIAVVAVGGLGWNNCRETPLDVSGDPD